MKIMKIRKVGNSMVVSLPHELESRGYRVGTQVMIQELPTGELRIVPTNRVRQFVRESARKVVAEDQEALRILADYEQQQAEVTNSRTADSR